MDRSNGGPNGGVSMAYSQLIIHIPPLGIVVRSIEVIEYFVVNAPQFRWKLRCNLTMTSVRKNDLATTDVGFFEKIE